MARGFNPLRAALGAVAGVTEGLQQREELAYKKEQDRQAKERQDRIDAQNLAMQLAGLQAQGWSAPEAFNAQRDDARGAIGSLVGSALQAASGGVPTGAPSAAGMKALQSGFATAADPTRKLSIGGRDLVLRETDDERQERLANTQAVQARTAQDEATRTAQQNVVTTAEGLMKAYPGLTREQALYAAKMGKDPVDLNMAERRMTAAERARLGLDQARFGLDREKFEFEKNKPQPITGPNRVNMPEGSRKRLEGYESGIYMVRDAVDMLKENPEAVGPIKGRMFRSVLDAYDKAGVGIRANIENLAGEIRNQRFGGALTATEAKFAESMLPSDKDLAENAITKLNQLEKYLETKRRALMGINKMEYAPLIPSSGASPTSNPYR